MFLTGAENVLTFQMLFLGCIILNTNNVSLALPTKIETMAFLQLKIFLSDGIFKIIV